MENNDQMNPAPQDQQPSLLRQKMDELMAQKQVVSNNTESVKTPEAENVNAAQNNNSNQSTEISETSPPQVNLETNFALQELMQTEWFKGLPNEHKEFIRSGGNPDKLMDELDKAVVQQQIEALQEINRVRTEIEGKSEITMEEYKAGVMFEDRNSNENDVNEDEADFIKMIKQELEGQDDSEDEEDAQERIFREVERRFEESIDVELEGATKNFDETSSALKIEFKRNKSYEETLKNILESNGIKVKTTKKGNLKKAVLKAYTQRHDHVTIPLVNSGFHVTLSGASIPEIIAISSIENPKSIMELEKKKLSLIKTHLVDTSFGQVSSLLDLMKIVHYKDEQTLYYGMFISTFPEVNDYPIECMNEKCKTPLNLKIHSADLVLNADEFKDDVDTILYKNMDIKDVMKQTKLSKIKQIILNDGTAVGIRIPSLYDRLMTMAKIEAWVKKSNKDTSNLNIVFGYLMFVEYIALPSPEGYIKFDQIDELIDILISMEPESHNEIDEQIEMYDKSKEIQYGIKSYVCPNCKRVHKQQVQRMDDLLFTLSQVKEMRNNLEKRKRLEKMKS